MDDGIRRAHEERQAKAARRPRTNLALAVLAFAGAIAACSSIVPTPATTSRVTPSPSPPATVVPSPTIAGVPLPAMPASLIGAPCADIATQGTLKVDPADHTRWWVDDRGFRFDLVWPPGSVATPDGVIHGPDGSILMRAGDPITFLCVTTAGEYYAVQWPSRS